MDFVVIHGAPGTGKSSLARALQQRLQGPCFEFGWIPEFRVRKGSVVPYAEEASLAFDNLVLVAKNYVKHGFDEIILTDLEDRFIPELAPRFQGYRYLLVTLWVADAELLKVRVLDESRSSDYRNWEAAVTLNREILGRDLLPNEVRLDSGSRSPDDLARDVIELVGPRDRGE